MRKQIEMRVNLDFKQKSVKVMPRVQVVEGTSGEPHLNTQHPRRGTRGEQRPSKSRSGIKSQRQNMMSLCTRRYENIEGAAAAGGGGTTSGGSKSGGCKQRRHDGQRRQMGRLHAAAARRRAAAPGAAATTDGGGAMGSGSTGGGCSRRRPTGGKSKNGDCKRL